MKSNDDQSNDYTKYFQIRTAKFITLVLIIVFSIYHGYLNLYYGRNSCNRLLGEGHVLGDNEWQPFGCMMHKYNKYDIDTCLKYVKFYDGKNNFIFIGDTRMRQISIQFIKKFDESYVPEDQLNSNLVYNNRNFNLNVSFYWFTTIDETLNSLFEKLILDKNKKTSFIMLGLGTWYIEYNSTAHASSIPIHSGVGDETLEMYKTNLTSLIETIRTLKYDNIDDSSSSSSNSKDELNIYWMLQDPIDEYKYKYLNNKTKLNNKQIDSYNRASLSLLHYSPFKIWSSSRLAAQGYIKDSPDGFKLGSFVLEIDSQILYNLYCNNKMNFNDGSCCSQPENMSLLQQIIFSFFIICCIITVYLYFYQRYCKNSKLRVNISGSEITLNGGCKDAASNGVYSFLTSLSRLAIIMLYFYACDSANFYMKENKHYTKLNFLIPLIYVTVLGLFFHDSSNMTTVLNRQQTDECKGFIQILILVYRISGADRNLALSLASNLFSSSYLFLTGYGHFKYYWTIGNYSAPRFFEILFRLNFLPILLCFTMNRMYQFYSFIPFVTFWFISIYLIMFLPPRVSVHSARDNPMHYFYMIVKLLFFAGLITTLNMSEIIFEKIFLIRPWKFLFVTADDLINDWKASWKRDSYTVLYGMGFGLIMCLLRRINIINDNDTYNDLIDDESLNDEISNDKTRLFASKRLNYLLSLLSVIGIIIYILFIFFCSNKQEYENIHAYLTILPIVSYIMLRNLVWSLREKCSYLFSWFGKITLELYICSFHILLAADSNGILVFLPGYPVLNILITLFIFICIAHELNLITKSLIIYFIPNNWKFILRNFCVFIILLMPIAIKYGYI